MYYIEDYKKKKEEENLNYVANLIIDKILNNINNEEIYVTDYMLTGYNNKLYKILNILERKAKNNNLELIIKTNYIPTSSTNLIISATKRNIFLKFMMIENDLYNKIIHDNKIAFDIKENKLNTLYILEALQTAFYQAGYDYSKIIINGNNYLLPACNKAKKYFSKVIPIEMINYYNNIEEERKNNIKKKTK